MLRRKGDLFTGQLPADIPPANTPLEWAGQRWTELLWPLPEDRLTREVMLAHEMFHRIQPALRLDAPDAANLQLDDARGRTLLLLEWRALAAALAGRGPARIAAIRDALAFRDERHRLFPGSAATEASLEIAEGVPEYTGDMIGAPDPASARWRAIGRLAQPDLTLSFVRAFAYLSGPPSGMLLDQRAPGWRKRLTKTSDLGAMLAATLPPAAPVSATARAAAYGAAAIRDEEADRAAAIAATVAHYRALLVAGPTLTLPNAGHFSFNFNPSTLVSLGGDGAVYPTFRASDAWGKLVVTGGVLVTTNFSKATLAAPESTQGSHLSGPGWTLELAPGWQVAPGARPGDLILRRP